MVTYSIYTRVYILSHSGFHGRIGYLVRFVSFMGIFTFERSLWLSPY